MTSKQEIIELIDCAIIEINQYINQYNRPIDSFNDFFIVLNSLKVELAESDTINERLLRGFKDICAITVKNFEGSNLEIKIFDIAEYFNTEISYYNSLEPLRMDFGKGNPV